MSVEMELDLERSLEQLEAKFMRLLETDRESAEFEALFKEVDRELGVLAGAAADRYGEPV